MDSNDSQMDNNMQYNFSKRPSTTVKKVSSSRAHGNSDATMKMNNTFQAGREKENSQTRKRMAMNSANTTNTNINFMT